MGEAKISIFYRSIFAHADGRWSCQCPLLNSEDFIVGCSFFVLFCSDFLILLWRWRWRWRWRWWQQQRSIDSLYGSAATIGPHAGILVSSFRLLTRFVFVVGQYATFTTIKRRFWLGCKPCESALIFFSYLSNWVCIFQRMTTTTTIVKIGSNWATRIGLWYYKYFW